MKLIDDAKNLKCNLCDEIYSKCNCHDKNKRFFAAIQKMISDKKTKVF